MNLFPKLEKKERNSGIAWPDGPGKWKDLDRPEKCLERHGRAKVSRKFQVSSYLLF